MFLVKRKSDGKFYKNPDYHIRRHVMYGNRDPETQWTTNPNECKPFLSESGAKRNFKIGGGEVPLSTAPIPTRFLKRDYVDWGTAYFSHEGQRYEYIKIGPSNDRHGHLYSMGRFDEENYEIIPVRIKEE